MSEKVPPSFGEVVDHLATFLRPIADASGGHLRDVPWQWAEHNVLGLEFGIYWIAASETFPLGAWVCSDEAGLRLFEVACPDEIGGKAGPPVATRGAAIELALQVGAHRLALDERVPDGVRTVLALHLTGQLPRPRQPRQNKSRLRALLTYTLVRMAHDFGGLRLTRNDAKRVGDSACDAAALALKEVGYHTTFRAAKEVAVGSKEENRRLRVEWERWCNAVAAALAHDPIARVAFPGVPDDFWWKLDPTVTPKSLQARHD